MIDVNNNKKEATQISNIEAAKGGFLKDQPELSKTKNDIMTNAVLLPKNLTQAVYFCQGLSFFFGLTAIVGICINYLKRDVVKGTIYESHFIWQIRTFWIGLVATIVGWITAVFFVGFLFIATVIVWNIYRVVKGYLLLLNNKPIPDPNALP